MACATDTPRQVSRLATKPVNMEQEADRDRDRGRGGQDDPQGGPRVEVAEAHGAPAFQRGAGARHPEPDQHQADADARLQPQQPGPPHQVPFHDQPFHPAIDGGQPT